jgi:hypothetical protein
LAAINTKGQASKEDFFTPGFMQVLDGENIIGHGTSLRNLVLELGVRR